MSKYSICTTGNVHTVRVASVESAPDVDYYHITEAAGKMTCDGDGPACHSEKECKHIKAVRRHLNK